MEKQTYIGEEENLKPKGRGYKNEYVPSDEADRVPDPETMHEMPGVDFEDWNEKENEKEEPIDPEKVDFGDFYIAHEVSDAHRQREAERELVEKAIAGDGRIKNKSFEKLQEENELVEEILAKMEKENRPKKQNLRKKNLSNLDYETANNIANHADDFEEEPVKHESMGAEALRKEGKSNFVGTKLKMQARTKDELGTKTRLTENGNFIYPTGPMLGRDNMKTLKRKALKDKNNPPFFKKLAKFFRLGEKRIERKLEQEDSYEYPEPVNHLDSLADYDIGYNESGRKDDWRDIA